MLTTANADAEALIVRTLRLPRLLIAVAVGAAPGLAGLLMQSVTRNPVAEPGLLGVNTGAAFAVVAVISVTGAAGLGTLALAAALGSLVATVLVFGLALASGPGMSPVHVLLAGVTVAALLAAGTQTLVILNETVMEELLFWLSGAFADRAVEALRFVLPVCAFGVAAGCLRRACSTC